MLVVAQRLIQDTRKHDVIRGYRAEKYLRRVVLQDMSYTSYRWTLFCRTYITWNGACGSFTQGSSSQWRHNGRDSVSNHQPHDCIANRLFRRRSMKTSKLRVTGFCAVNSPVTGEFPVQMASKAENGSVWWRHHVHKHCINSHERNPYIIMSLGSEVYQGKYDWYRHQNFIPIVHLGARKLKSYCIINRKGTPQFTVERIAH